MMAIEYWAAEQYRRWRTSTAAMNAAIDRAAAEHVRQKDHQMAQAVVLAMSAGHSHDGMVIQTGVHYAQLVCEGVPFAQQVVSHTMSPNGGIVVSVETRLVECQDGVRRPGRSIALNFMA